jgi:hypothetical protein
MGSIVPDDTDFREHVAELGVLHVERDNRLPRAWNIVAKLIAGILRLVSGEEHDFRANPQNASIVHAVVPDFLHPLGYPTAKGIASPTRRDNAVLAHISCRVCAIARAAPRVVGFTNNLVARLFAETRQRMSLAPCRKRPHGLEESYATASAPQRSYGIVGPVTPYIEFHSYCHLRACDNRQRVSHRMDK